jgi:hypothetical protein
MNWIQKLSQIRSGYLAIEGPVRRHVRWEERQAELDGMRDKARADAENKVAENGHTLKPWDDVNQSYCTKCNKQISLRNVHSTGGATLHGPAAKDACGDKPGIHDLIDYRVNGYIW